MRQENVNREACRFVIVIISVGMASAAFRFVGDSQIAERLFHRWYNGIAIVFISMLVLSLWAAFRGRIRCVARTAISGAVIGQVVGGLSEIAYFSVFFPDRFLRSLPNASVQHIAGWLFIEFIFLPGVSFCWFVGGAAGVIYALFGIILEWARAKAKDDET